MKLQNELPVNIDIVLYRGDTFKRVISYKNKATPTSTAVPVDLTGYVIRGAVKRTRTASEAKFNLTVSNRNDVEGTFTIAFPEAIIEPLRLSSLVYDLELVSSSGEITTLFTGNITLNLDVTGS